jgi:signal transduction histidine kinase
VCLAAERGFNLAIAISSTAAGWKRRRRRVVVPAMLAAAVVETAWIARLAWPARACNNRRLLWCDTAFVSALILVRGLLVDDDTEEEFGWVFEYGLTGIANAGIGFGPGLEGAFAAATLTVAHRATHTDPADRAAVVAYPGAWAAAALAASQLREGARALGASRALAMQSGTEAAAQAERLRQHQRLHDSALQTIEAATGRWDVDDATIRERARMEADRLRAGYSKESDTLAPLGALLRGVASEIEALGLDVHLDIDRRAEAVSGVTAAAVCGAVREALVNVRKHAGTQQSRIEVTIDDDQMTVTVRDRGTGFDPGTATSGFGLRHSIGGPVARVGGDIRIVSAPGSGTTVHIRAPLREPAGAGR